MKEIKEFIQELCDCAKPSANGSMVLDMLCIKECITAN